MSLSNRYNADSRSTIELSTFQKGLAMELNEEIRRDVVEFEEITCLVCGERDYTYISEKDRYGVWQPVVICKTCGLIFSNPRMTNGALRYFYEKYHKRLYTGSKGVTQDYFDRQYRKGERISSFINDTVDSGKQIETVYEIGSASGGILHFFQNQGCKVAGNDLDPEYVEYGRRMGLDISYGTIYEDEVPFRPDLVVYSDTLEHLSDPLSDLTHLRGKSHKSTLIYVKAPGVYNVGKTVRKDFLRSLQSAHTAYFTLSTLTNLMNAAGFSLVYGTEQIQAIYRPHCTDVEFENEYADTLNFLKKLERYRSMYRMSFKCRKMVAEVRRLLMRLLLGFNM